jgi:hypothetical protein
MYPSQVTAELNYGSSSSATSHFLLFILPLLLLLLQLRQLIQIFYSLLRLHHRFIPSIHFPSLPSSSSLLQLLKVHYISFTVLPYLYNFPISCTSSHILPSLSSHFPSLRLQFLTSSSHLLFLPFSFIFCVQRHFIRFKFNLQDIHTGTNISSSS